MKHEYFTPRPFETCVVCDPEHRKHNSLLFDRVHAWEHETHIPSEVVFRVPEVDTQIRKQASAEAGAVLYGAPVGFNYASLRRFQVEAYVKLGIDATPSYNTHKLFSWDFEPGKVIAYEAALHNIPIISDADVAWNQILEFRMDSEAKGKCRDLRYWLHYALKLNDVSQATDLIGQKINDYVWAIEKHGLKTTLGALLQIFDWKQSAATSAVAGVAGATGGPIWSTIITGLLIEAQFRVSLAETKLKLTDTKRSANREVAVIYDNQQGFGDM